MSYRFTILVNIVGQMNCKIRVKTANHVVRLFLYSINSAVQLTMLVEMLELFTFIRTKIIE